MSENVISSVPTVKPERNNSSRSQQPVAFPVMILLLVSSVAVTLTVVRIELSGNWRYMSLIWNLFLAWLPLVFALGVYRRHQRDERRGGKFYSLSALWLLFLPNAPYIFTDLTHLSTRFFPHFWPDLSLVLLFSFTGFLLGFLSLYLMQSVVTEIRGRVIGWLFTAGATGLASCGIYLGRFLRRNSWDVVTHPVGLSHDIGYLAVHPLANPHSLAFLSLFATFLFLGYLMLYALTHLRPLTSSGPAAA